MALVGSLVFIIGNRRFYGGWGGVGGWYVWGWTPWIFVAVDDFVAVSTRGWRILLPATTAFVVAANLVYFVMAFRLYA